MHGEDQSVKTMGYQQVRREVIMKLPRKEMVIREKGQWITNMQEYETIVRHLKLNVSARKCLRPTYSTMPFQSNQISMRNQKLRRETQKSKTVNEPEGGR